MPAGGAADAVRLGVSAGPGGVTAGLAVPARRSGAGRATGHAILARAAVDARCCGRREYCPLLHGAHDVAPVSVREFVTDPSPQLPHGVVEFLENSPAGHTRHNDWPSAGTVPGRHVLQRGAADWLYLPASQAAHSVVALGEYWPLLQPLHSTPPPPPPPAASATPPFASLTTDPALQSVHMLALGPLYWPAPQLPHAVLVTLCLPAGHDLQNAWLVASWYFPLGQAVHDAADEATLASKAPLSHAMHDGWPCAGWCLPAAQPMQSPAATDPAVVTYRPLGHCLQSDASTCPLASRYSPGLHAMHASVAAVEYLPASHSVQLLPPTFATVSVIEPGLQALHVWVG